MFIRKLVYSLLLLVAISKNTFAMPLLGDKFPNLKVQTTQGTFELEKKFKGKWFVLFSHPGDFTPVCTTEFIGFQEAYQQFKDMNTELIGLSVDQVYSHISWIKNIKDKFNSDIKFPIIAANDEIAKQLGMMHPGKGSNTVRAVFIVDQNFTVRLIMYYPQEIGRNMSEILRVVKALQLSDKENVAIPLDWPNNKTFGSDVIIKPANTIELAEDRMNNKDAEKKCIDWWFCYKTLKK
jgi:peroxiredoxin (alkyl hydroperoxide reductase subunit C)